MTLEHFSVTLEHFSVKAIFCTIPVYGTQKKLSWRESNHCQNIRHFMGFKKKFLWHGSTPSEKFSVLSFAYQLSQSVHHASADIFKNISTVPSTGEFQLFLLFLLFCYFSLSVFFTCSVHNHINNPPTRV